MRRHRRRHARSNPLNAWMSILIPAATGAVAGYVVQTVIDGATKPTAGAPLAGAAVGALAGGLGELMSNHEMEGIVGLASGLALGYVANSVNQKDIAAYNAANPTTTAPNQLPGGTTSSTTTPNPTAATPAGTTPAGTTTG